MKRSATILFIDKSFLKPPSEFLRGVELFNFGLLRDLENLGFKTTIVAEESWRNIFAEEFASVEPEILWLKHRGTDFVNCLVAAIKLARRKFDYLLMGNVGKGIVPGVHVLNFFSVFKKSLVIANREASAGYVKLCAKLDTCVLAVNEQIAKPFRDAGCSRVQVDYGVMEGEKFFPQAKNNGDASRKVRFCVLGMLDNAWKGSDTAMEAFKGLPEKEKKHFELHLASYSSPPQLSEENVKPYPWLPSEEIAPLLRKMDVLLVLSRDEHIMRETFCQALVQGMLTALPVITTDLPIFREKLDLGGGIITNDIESIKKAMLTLGGDDNLRREMGEQARETALKRYVWNTQKFAEKYIS